MQQLAFTYFVKSINPNINYQSLSYEENYISFVFNVLDNICIFSTNY